MIKKIKIYLPLYSQRLLSRLFLEEVQSYRAEQHVRAQRSLQTMQRKKEKNDTLKSCMN